MVHVTGNTVVDALSQNLGISQSKSRVLEGLGLGDEFFLVTLHRAENVDDENKLRSVISALGKLGESYGLKVVFPIHPRTRKMIDAFKLSTDGIITTDPMGYLDFLQLEARARLILTDSGGVQEEACVLKVPCVTLRDNTERPETVEVGANVVAGTDPSKIISDVGKMLAVSRSWGTPFGGGDAGVKIVKIIEP
jgi:UDP-N-acetylglucosamine 2-epimerase (non-hydrolysing)